MYVALIYMSMECGVKEKRCQILIGKNREYENMRWCEISRKYEMTSQIPHRNMFRELL